MPYFGQRPSYRSTFDPESEPIVQKPRGGLAGLMEQLPAQTREGLQSYGMGDILMDLGMPAAASAGAWKLSPNAPSWLRRAFESGKREIPLRETVPARRVLTPEVLPGKRKALEPEVVSTPSDEIPGNFLKQLGLPTRLEDAKPGTPLHEALYWQRAMGGSEVPLKKFRGLVKNPVTYELPESNAGLRQLLEQEGGAYTGLGGEEGTTRLYRGEGPGPIDIPKWAKTGGHAGDWFTPNKKKAQGFQSFYDKGRLKFVDVPQGELEQYGVFKNAIPDEYVIPREIQDKLWTRFLKEQPESFGKRKLPPASGAPARKALVPEVISKDAAYHQDSLVRDAKTMISQWEQEGWGPQDVFERVRAVSDFSFIDDARLKQFIRDEFVPPVSGGAPSPFDKFTSKGLPVPQNMWDPGYKSTQDIIGNWAHRETGESSYKPAVRNADVDEFVKRFAEKRMSSVRGALENNPINPIEAVRELGKAFGADDVETAALVQRYVTVTPGNRGTVPLSRLLTPQKYNDLMSWVKSQLGH